MANSMFPNRENGTILIKYRAFCVILRLFLHKVDSWIFRFLVRKQDPIKYFLLFNMNF